MSDIWPTFHIRQIIGYLALEISRVSGNRIVSISGIQLDIENGQISGPTLVTMILAHLLGGTVKYPATHSLTLHPLVVEKVIGWKSGPTLRHN